MKEFEKLLAPPAKLRPWEKCKSGLIYKAVAYTYLSVVGERIYRRMELRPQRKLSPCYKCEWKGKCWWKYDKWFWGEDPLSWLESLDLESVVEGKYYMIKCTPTCSCTDWGQEYDTEVELVEVQIKEEDDNDKNKS